jgi:membrane fusion protein, multidrug efflux system
MPTHSRPPFPVQRVPLLPVVATLASLVLIIAGCNRSSAQQPQAPERPPAQVSVTSVITHTVPIYLDAIGRAVATETVSIVPQVGGTIVTAEIEDGAFVRKGQLLFEIDRRPFLAALASAQAGLQQAQAEYDYASVEYNRVKNLPTKGAVSQQEINQRQNAVEVAQAHIASAKAAIETAELNLNYARIYSPIDGRAGVRLIDVGNVVKANDVPLLNIQAMDPILAEFTITENDLGTVRKFLAARSLDLTGSARNLRVEVDVPGNSPRVLGALGGLAPTTRPATAPVAQSTTSPATPPATSSASQPAVLPVRTGQLVFLDNSVQTTTGTVRLRAQLANADHYFWPGQFVNVRLVLAEKPDAVLIPSQAEQIGQQGAYVYVVTNDNTAELRPIVSGQRQGDLLVVEKGLQPGEKVVVSGQYTVVPGSKVQIAGAASPAPDASPGPGPTSAPAHATEGASASAAQ